LHFIRSPSLGHFEYIVKKKGFTWIRYYLFVSVSALKISPHSVLPKTTRNNFFCNQSKCAYFYNLLRSTSTNVNKSTILKYVMCVCVCVCVELGIRRRALSQWTHKATRHGHGSAQRQGQGSSAKTLSIEETRRLIP
jgi:hypothetical protein